MPLSSDGVQVLYKDKPFGYSKGTVFTKHPKTALIVLNYGKVQYVQNLHILLRKERHTNVMTIEGNIPDAILGYHLTLIYFSFFFRYFRRKIVLLRHRAVVAYGCLLSGLHDICNTFTQVADRYNVLILRK